MLKEIILKNYRGFDHHAIPFSTLNVIVGANNAGKSTVVEALRILSLITTRYKNLAFRKPPEWLELSSRYMGVSPSLQNSEINFDSICHQYNNSEPAIIEAFFTNNAHIEIFLNNKGGIHSVIYTSEDRIISSKAMALRLDLPSVNILPLVAPLHKEEKILDEDYVKRSINSPLSNLHFRNQLRIYNNLWSSFQVNVSESWPGVFINNLDTGNGLPGTSLFLEVRNEGFVSEASLMGHGLQMWLQLIWFLTLNKESDIIILDEPDIYMHADLQKKLIRMVRKAFPQVILTTHSIEIISEVHSKEILMVDKNVLSSKFASNLSMVQKIIEKTGSIHNIQLTRLWRTKKVLFVEGKDIKYLKHFQEILYPNSIQLIDNIPNMSIGGWGGWNYVIGSGLFLKNNLDEDIKIYCLFDSDYHSDIIITQRRKEAIEKNIYLHIWSKKEIENYLIIPGLLYRVIKNRSTKSFPSVSIIENQIHNYCNDRKDELLDFFSDEISQTQRYSSKLANRIARNKLSKYIEEDHLYYLISGKSVISYLSNWSQREYQVSFGITTLLENIVREEISEEIKEVIDIIES